MGKTAMLEWLGTTPIPLTEISRQTGISRNTLYAWVSKKSEIRDSNYLKVVDKYGDFFTTKGESMALSSEGSVAQGEIESHYVIGLQKDKIAYQQEEIDSLKTVLKEKQAESTHWDMLEFDYITKTRLIRTGFKIGRAILSVDTVTPLAEKLGYTEDELSKYFTLGNEYPEMDDHPINDLIDEDSKKILEEHTKSMPYIFDSLKNLVGNHYLPVPVTYICKNGVNKVHTITYNKINWSKLRVVSKCQFIDN